METTESKTWGVDNSHSHVNFSARHMVISEAKGSFGAYTIKAETNGLDFNNAKIELEIDVNSITTGAKDRDGHLLSPDFFDAANFPKINFVSTSMTKVDEEEYKLSGNITIKDVTKLVDFKVTYGGQIVDPYGFHRAGFSLESSINRFDFGLNWNALLEAGGAMVGKNIKLNADIEMITKK